MDMRLFGVLNGVSSLLLLLWFICCDCGFGQSINVLDLTRIRGTWIYDSNSCYLENKNINYDYSNLIWFGESDGITYNSDYDFDTFILEVEFEILSHNHASSHVGILFRAQSVLSSSISYGGKQYFVGLKPDTNQIILSKIDGGWTLLYSQSFNVNYNTRYVLKVEAKHVLNSFYYDVYVNNIQIWSDIELNDFTVGSIGLRSHRALSTYHSVTLTRSCVEFGLFLRDTPELVEDDGWILLQNVGELNDLKQDFITFYNNNGGLSPISVFGSQNCCFGFRKNDTYLTIGQFGEYWYLYPAYDGSVVCSFSPGFVQDKYQFYRFNGAPEPYVLESLNNNYTFGTTNACIDDSNPAIYKRFC